MAATLKLEIVTPAATVYSEDVQMVTLPAVDGQIGIFPRHVPVLTRIVPGEIIVRKNGENDFLAVGEGLVEITGDRIAIVTDMAVWGEGNDETRGGGGRQRAAARLRGKNSHRGGDTPKAPRARPPSPRRAQRKKPR